MKNYGFEVKEKEKKTDIGRQKQNKIASYWKKNWDLKHFVKKKWWKEKENRYKYEWVLEQRKYWYVLKMKKTVNCVRKILKKMKGSIS